MQLLDLKNLWLLGLLAPLVVLYILKVKRHRRRISSTWLWVVARRDLMARSPFKKLVVQVPLILQALALLALGFAAARPATRGRTLTGEHIAIIVDTSASMSATDPETGKPRIELAKKAARELVLALSPGSDAMVLDAGRDARVMIPPDRDTRRLRAAIDRIAARDVEGDVGAAVALAVARMKQLGGERNIIVLTDGNWARPAAIASPAVPVEVVTVGKPVANCAIVRVDVRAGMDPVLAREQAQAFLLVGNYGTEPRELFVTMREQNASDVLASRRVRVPAGEQLPVVLTFNPAPGDYGRGLIFDISPHDDMPVDDVAYGRVPSGRKLPVLFAAKNKPSPWLLRALVADEHAEVRTGGIKELLSSPEAHSAGLVVVEGACPTQLPAGDVLIINPPGGNCYGTVVGSEIERPLITSWDHGDERMRFLTLDGVHIATARSLESESKHQELVRTDKGVIATDISTSSRSATLVGFDPGESNWPLKASFVLFVRNLLELARLHRSRGVSGPAHAGEPLRVSVSPAVSQLEFATPDGDKRDIVVRGGLAVVPEVERIGLYRLSWQEPAPGWLVVPVNLVSSGESDLRKQPEQTEGDEVKVTAAETAVESHRDWNWALALLALAFIVFDVWYLTRRARSVRLTVGDKPRLPDRRAA